MDSLSKYELQRELGTGSMGTVYLARDTVLDRDVALKTIKTGTVVDPEIRERFYREARTCAKLQHPNIVTVHDLGEDKGFAFIAMELLNGSDLRRLITQKTSLPLQTKLDTMVRVCEALAHAHREGIVHRDIKPSNLFLDNEGRAKVLDFGIARLPSSRLTVVGRVLGTPNYMAPEQILGQKTDGRADLFSAAVVFFEFLVYHHPFQASLVPRRIVDGEPDSVFDFDSAVPIPFERIFEKAFQKNPEKRYVNGDELAGDIRAVLDAIRLNSSPTFSKLTLPSATTAADGSAAEAPLFNQSPDLTDPEEWRLSEFLRLLPDFEDAVESRAIDRAALLLEQLKAIEAVDPRFSESVAVNTARLEELRAAQARNATSGKTGRVMAATQGSSSVSQVASLHDSTILLGEAQAPMQPPAQPASPELIADDFPGSTACPTCGAMNRPKAVFCGDCGARIAVKAPEPAPEPKNGPDPKEGYAKVAAPARGSGLPINIAAYKDLWLNSMRNPRVLLSAAASICAVLVLLLVLILRGPSMEDFVAVGYVANPVAVVLSPDASSSAPSLVRAPEGTQVHILRLPGDSMAPLPVQIMDHGKPGPRGRLRLQDLRGIEANTGPEALEIARRLDVTAAADLPTQIAVFRRIAQRFPGNAKEALIALGERQLRLAKKEQSEHPDGTWWQTLAKEAKHTVAGYSGDGEAQRVQGNADDLLAPPQPPAPIDPTTPTPVTPIVGGTPQPPAQALRPTVDRRRIAKLITDAKGFQEDGYWQPALTKIREVLSLDPTNAEALKMRKEVLKAIEIDSTSQEPEPPVKKAPSATPIGSVQAGSRSSAGVVAGIIGSLPSTAPSPTSPPPVNKAPSAIHVGGQVQMANILSQEKPLYPPLARSARIQGTVRFNALIGKDGTIQNLQVVSGHPLLVQAAMDAVRRWVYKRTLLNGEPVDVITTIDVNFTLQ